MDSPLIGIKLGTRYVGHAQRAEALQRLLCPAFDTIGVPGGGFSRQAIPIGAVGVVKFIHSAVGDEQNKKLESLEVKV